MKYAGVHDFEDFFFWCRIVWGLRGFAGDVGDFYGDVAVLFDEFGPPGSTDCVFLGGDFVGEFGGKESAGSLPGTGGSGVDAGVGGDGDTDEFDCDYEIGRASCRERV